MQMANERRAEARHLDFAGNEAAAAILRASARNFRDSAQYWNDEVMRLAKTGAQAVKHPR
jgi:hypothetical protein